MQVERGFAEVTYSLQKWARY